MKHVLLFAASVITAMPMANATDLDVKIAASFAAKYEVCGNKLKNAKIGSGWRIKAAISKERASDLSRKYLFEKGYVKHLEKEKKKIRNSWTRKRCKTYINDRLED